MKVDFTGIYLKCDSCGETLDGAQVAKNPEKSVHKMENGGAILREWARALGWKRSEQGLDPHYWKDYCPMCVWRSNIIKEKTGASS
jgi:hypothetical protein